MRVLFEPAPVYFMHVPKTGGTTLAQWLRSAYGRGYFDLNLPQITRLANRDVRGFRCYHSWHHGRSLFDWLGRADLTVITILRDPVERAASAFGHRQRAHAQHPERFKPEFQARFRALPETDLREFLDDDLTVRDYSNAQSRLLGGRKDYGAFLAAVAQAEPAAQAEALLRPYQVPPITDMHDLPLLYANACAWLDEMAVVGLTERYAESMLLIGDLLGIPLPAHMPRANVNPQRTDPAMRYRDRLAPDVVARLEELNRQDQELYAHATELFEQQWARYRAKPRRTYSIAPRLRIPLRRAKSGLKGWLRRL